MNRAAIKTPMTRHLRFFEAIREAQDLCMAKDPSVYVMGLGVPAIAWIERSALLLLLGFVALAAIGAALWWGARGKRA